MMCMEQVDGLFRGCFRGYVIGCTPRAESHTQSSTMAVRTRISSWCLLVDHKCCCQLADIIQVSTLYHEYMDVCSLHVHQVGLSNMVTGVTTLETDVETNKRVEQSPSAAV